MSRASEITLLLIILQASMGFVDSIGMFDAHYISGVSNNASYTISDLDVYGSQLDKGFDVVEAVMTSAYWAWEGFIIGFKIIWTVVFVFPMLVDKFHVPAELSLFIQAGVYYIYAVFISQFRSGKGWSQIREV